MTKKAVHIVLSLLLIISTTGITISKHYSGGELFSIALLGEADSCCDGPCDCCSDEIYYFHVDTNSLEAFTLKIEKQEVKQINLFVNFLFVVLFTETFNTSPLRYVCDTSPTYTSNPPAFLQVFRC